jgi:hypothetical protein
MRTNSCTTSKAYTSQFLYDTVTVSSPDNGDDGTNIYVSCPGIILQHIEGFDLADLGNEQPPQHWQGICEMAIEIVLQVQDRGICNEAVRPRNFIVKCNSDCEPQQTFMVDFGHCTFRENMLGEYVWRKYQAYQAEEEAVGRRMEWTLQRIKKGWYTYRLSERADLSHDFNREDLPGNQSSRVPPGEVLSGPV